MIRAVRGLAAAILVGSLLCAGGVGTGGPPPAAAATPDLTIVAAAAYTVVPARHLVHVTVDMRATNHHADTVIRRYYVDHAVLSVQPGASGFAATIPGSKVRPRVTIVARSPSATLISIAFGTQLGSGRTLGLRLTFDLIDRGGAPARSVRVGSALVGFPVWAFGTAGTPGGSIAVTVPAGYAVAVQGGPLRGPTTDASGVSHLAAGPIANSLTFGAYVVADRPGAYRETSLSVTVGGRPASIVVRSWLDDAQFGARVTALLRMALPKLGSMIGIPIPAAVGGASTAAPILVDEAVTRTAGGYAGLFDPANHRITLAYDASPAVIVDEAAHLWFNGTLVADGWAAEGFASYYAGLAARTLKITMPSTTLTKALLAVRIPLNAWDVGRSRPATEAYGRAAAVRLASLVVARAGSTGMASVWSAAAGGQPADLPVHGPATGSAEAGGAEGPPDWRSLLDLLETRTGRSFTDLWRTWVARPADAALLDARTTARADFAAAIAEAGSWELPASIRTAIDAWQFPLAEQLIAEARAVLAQRAGLSAAAGAAGLTEPSIVRAAFETGPDPAHAAAVATAERQAIAAISADAGTRASAGDLISSIGLLGADPDASMAAARSAFAAGDLEAAVADANAARTAWVGAASAGRTRLAILGLGAAAFGLGVLLVSRRRDRRRVRLSPYGTLADDPRPAPRSGREPGDDR